MSAPTPTDAPPLGSLARLWRFARRYLIQHWPWLVAGLVFLTLTNWLTVQIPTELARAIDLLHGEAPPAEVLRYALRIGWMGVAVIAVRTLSRVLFFTPGRSVEHALRADLFGQLMRLQPGFFAQHSTGDIVNRATSDMQFIRVMAGFGTLQTANVALALVLTGRQMVVVSPLLTLLALGPVLLGVAITQAGIVRMFRLSTQTQQQLGEISDHILASLQGVRTIQGFNAEGAFVARLAEREDRYLQTNLRVAALRQWVLPVLGLMALLSTWLMLAVGGPMSARGELSVGELVAFVAYIGMLLTPLRGLGFVISVFQRGVISLTRVDELLYAEAERPEGPAPLPLPSGALGLRLQGLGHRWSPSAARPALEDLHADIPPGALIGVFGRTGAGKSTLLRVLARLANPPPGQVLVVGADGAEVDLRAVDLDAWRRRVALVSQTPFLFSDTLESNIAAGEPDPARVREAAARAALSTDLSALPQGLATVVGERGITLSGGQRQRVALARGLYRDYDVLLLDDVLSAVDQRTERQLIDTLEALAQTGREGRGRPTVVLVSHRQSALARADRVLVLDEGRLVDQGTHAELLQRPGPYRDAWLAHQDEPAQEVG